VQKYLEKCKANLKQASDSIQHQQQNQPADANDKAANDDWQKEMDAFLDEEKQWSLETQHVQDKFDTMSWTPDEIKCCG
jgi:hypothetical protein